MVAQSIPSNLTEPTLNNIIKKVIKTTKYIKPAFIAIKDDWYKENRSLFTLKSKGKYIDLADSTKRQKQYLSRKGKIKGATRPPYPILLGTTGRLKTGLTKEKSPYSVNEITDTTLMVGIKGLEYPILHQKGLGQKRRPFIFKSKKDDAPDQWTKQTSRWRKTLIDYQTRRLKNLGRQS